VLLLTSTSDKLQVVTASAVTVDVHASWVDNLSGTITPGRTNTAITTAATTDVVAAPAASTQRNIQTLSIRNKHASSSNAVTIRHTDGTTIVEIFKYTLLAGEQIEFLDNIGFRVISASGEVFSAPNSTPLGVVPVGGIIMWSGLIAAIPTHWALCDGTTNSPGPDLRDKFVVGATSDSGGVAKTNIEGSLKQTGGVTGHSHSAHANLTHAGLTIGDHTGLTHGGLAIADHPDLTHAALSHPAITITHADHSAASQSHTHAAITVTPGDLSIASHANITVPSHSHAVVTVATAKGATGTGATWVSNTATSIAGPSMASIAGASIAAVTYTHAGISVPSFTGSEPAFTLTHADHSMPSLSHNAIGTHVGTSYGSHAITQPNAHGAAGTLTHSFNQPNDHTISAHDTVLSLPTYFALAFIQRMS
jgi:hypothetical protein